ncbi:hypothetical protein SAMN02745866_02189 [Alteromonadaceae bacterium Bs31]|nr:hypothetical protein SAMN02745866_02189 [Alteromonadaceae bacterium Bs31]
MSLINDTLRDLDARHKREGAALLAAPEAQARKGKSNFIVPGVVLLGVLCLAVYWALPSHTSYTTDTSAEHLSRESASSEQPDQNEQLERKQQKAPRAFTAESDKLVSQVESDVPESINAAGGLTSLESSPAIEQTSQDLTNNAPESPGAAGAGKPAIELVVRELNNEAATAISKEKQLLEKASIALARNRLTLPAEDNAYHFYSLLMQEYPQSIEAEKGIERIESRYKELLELALHNNDAKRLQHLLARVDSVQLRVSGIEHYRSAATRLAEQHQTKLAEQTRPVKTKALAQSEDKTGSMSVSIAKTLATQDRLLSQRQMEAYNAGQVIEAKSALEQFVAAKPSAVLSRLALFDIYLRENAIQQADALRRQAFKGSVLHDYMQAKLFIAKEQFLSARNMLEQHNFSEIQLLYSSGQMDQVFFEQYNSLLAALYQQQKEHLLAAERYQLLVSVDVVNAQYWLGYALSSDSLGHKQNALRAYEQVLRLGDVDKKAQRYVVQRQASLHQELRQNIAGASVSP